MATISAERLDLVPMTPAFLEASRDRRCEEAERIMGLSIPAAWFEEGYLITLRLEGLRREPTYQPWSLRAIGLRETGEMVGYIGFHTPPDPEYLRDIAPGGIEFGYTVFPAYRRRGYAREASRALMDWAYAQGVRRFVLSISSDNIASCGLAEQLGFIRVGQHRDERDGFEDEYVLDWGIVRDA